MTFEGQYLTYAEYQELGGSAIGNMPFNLLEFEARRKIDINTQNRLKGADYVSIPQEVKLCEYALINTINEFAITMDSVSGNKGISQETTDGYSIQYLTGDRIAEIVNSKNTELNDIIRTYLLLVEYNGDHYFTPKYIRCSPLYSTSNR